MPPKARPHLDRRGLIPDSGGPKGSNVAWEEVLMRSLGAIFLLLAFVVLMLDSRRFRALVRSNGWRRHDPQAGMPAGANPDRVGLTLRQIQMRIPADRQDGGASAA